MQKAIDRMLFSWAWMLMPYANAHVKTPSRLKIPLSLRGDAKFIGDLFMGHDYDPYFDHLKNIKSWIDLGCNSGIVSLAIYDHLQDRTGIKAVLVDAGKKCIQAVERAIRENQLGDRLFALNALIGPSGSEMQFNEIKHGLTSSAVIANRLESVSAMRCLSIQDVLRRYNMMDGADLLKIDIEGSEKYIIPDQGESLDLFRFVWLEYHRPHLEWGTVQDFIIKHGYRILVHQDGENSGMVLWEKSQ